MHFVSPSQLPPTHTFPPSLNSTLVVRGSGPSLLGLSSRLPLCFLFRPPLGFLLIPIYSIFYKSL